METHGDGQSIEQARPKTQKQPNEGDDHLFIRLLKCVRLQIEGLMHIALATQNTFTKSLLRNKLHFRLWRFAGTLIHQISCKSLFALNHQLSLLLNVQLKR